MPSQPATEAGSGRQWIVVAAFALIVAMGIGVVVVGALRSPTPPQITIDMDWTVEQSCPDAVMIGAAGSGQGDDLLGVGSQVGSALSGFGGQLAAVAQGPVDVGFVALDYPALGVIEGGLLAFMGDTIVESIDEGRRELQTLIGSIGERCEGLPIYLVGYSQGASVIRTALDELPEALHRSIGGVAVIADPYRDGEDPGVLQLTNEPDQGPEGLTPHDRNGMMGGLVMPAWLDAPFYSACARQDAVCNFSFSDLLITSLTHTEETYHGLGPELGRLLADDLLERTQ